MTAVDFTSTPIDQLMVEAERVLDAPYAFPLDYVAELAAELRERALFELEERMIVAIYVLTMDDDPQ